MDNSMENRKDALILGKNYSYKPRSCWHNAVWFQQDFLWQQERSLSALANMVTASSVWLLNTWNVAVMTKTLGVCSILIKLKKLNWTLLWRVEV